MIDQLTDAECEITERVARRVNVVIEAVEALRRQFEQHIAAEDGADPPAGESVNVLDLDAIESRAHRLAAVRSLRAERDAALARVAELEQERDTREQAADWVERNALNKEDTAMLERFAALEHEQWAHWTRYMLDNMTPENVARWRRQIETPYEALTEKEKDSDREWARRVMDVWGSPCPSCGQVPEGQGGEYPCSTCDLPTVHDERPDPEYARYAAILALHAERDEAQARVAELEADAALGALVRRMQRRVIVERLRDGTYSVGLRGEPRVYFRDEERTFAWAADDALGEEAADAH